MTPIPTRTVDRRAGILLLEIQVALAILGIMLAGLVPVILAQLTLLRGVEEHVYCLYPEVSVDVTESPGTTDFAVRPSVLEARWSGPVGVPGRWTVRHVKVSPRAPVPTELSLTDSGGMTRAIAGRAPGKPQATGLRWIDATTSNEFDPPAFDSWQLDLPASFRAVELTRGDAEAIVTIGPH